PPPIQSPPSRVMSTKALGRIDAERRQEGAVAALPRPTISIERAAFERVDHHVARLGADQEVALMVSGPIGSNVLGECPSIADLDRVTGVVEGAVLERVDDHVARLGADQ